MDHPCEGEPKQELNSRYALVMAVARRAKQLKEGAPPLVESTSSNPITIALKEISEGLVKVVIPTPEEMEAAAARMAVTRAEVPSAADMLRMASTDDEEPELATGEEALEEPAEASDEEALEEAAIVASEEEIEKESTSEDAGSEDELEASEAETEAEEPAEKTSAEAEEEEAAIEDEAAPVAGEETSEPVGDEAGKKKRATRAKKTTSET